MTAVRMIPAHEVVRRTFPRPPPQERDHVAMAEGKAIDGALSQLGHQLRQGRRPSQASMVALAASLLDESLEEAAVALAPEQREASLRRVQDVIRAYRRSEIAGLARPKTRVILIEGKVGVYAQPDYWDGHGRVFEMKSYRAIPPPPDVLLQLRLFQLAFPQSETVLVCLDRHASPVEVASLVMTRPTEAEVSSCLREAFRLGSEFGEEKVLEYVEGPFVAYRLPDSGPQAD